MKISVAIILKNDLGVANTIAGLNRQEIGHDFEIIVIDRSTITYPKIESKRKLRWLSYENQSQKYTIPQQRNVVIKEAFGSIIVFIDAGCVPEHDWLHEIVTPILEGGEMIVAGQTGSVGKQTLNDLAHKKNASKEYLTEAPTLNLAIHTDVINTIGGFDEQFEYGSDVDFTWRAIEHGYKIRYAPNAYVEHDWGSKKDEFNRTILYGKARARLLFKHLKSHWRNLFTSDSPVLLYPTLIVLFFVLPLFPWSLLPYPLLVLKNIREPNPVGIVAKHMVYGLGVIIELVYLCGRLLKIMFQKILTVSLTYHLGFALLFTIIFGLTTNYLLPHLGINNPLSARYVWPASIFYISFAIKLIYEVAKWFRINTIVWPLLLLYLINPILAITGAKYLDNTGSGILAIASVAAICISFLATYIQRNNSANILKPALYSAGLSLLLANSMRSNYLVGWDIHQEYMVFQLTSMHDLWNINTLKDAYNACLSITILPTIIHNLTGIAPLTIMKLIYPMIIAFLPVIVFQIGDRLSSPKIAYVGAFAFLLQAQFISQLPALTRQGIAFVFFALMVDTLVLKRSSYYFRTLIFTLFGIGMVFSHYSTTYVTLFILLTAKVLSLIISKLGRYHEGKNPLSWISIFVLFIVAFTWNVMITDTAGGLQHTVTRVRSNMQDIFSFENKSDAIKGIAYIQKDNSAAVEKYSHESIVNSGALNYFEKYAIQPISLDNNRPFKLTEPIPFYFHIVIPWIFRLSIVIGFFYILFYEYKYRQSTLILGLSLSMFGITFLIAVLPSLSLDYNFERLFQQVLVLLSPICAIGFYAFILKLKKVPPNLFVALVLTSYLLQTTGLVMYSAYGKPTWMFSKTGEQHYRYFTTGNEVVSIKWLDTQKLDNQFMYADKYSKLRFMAYTKNQYSYISSMMNPPEMEDYGYVSFGNASINANAVFAQRQNFALTFATPKNYMYDTKNTIYTNSGAQIYR